MTFELEGRQYLITAIQNSIFALGAAGEELERLKENFSVCPHAYAWRFRGRMK